MGTITFDTPKFSDTLKASGVPPAQAEAEARALAAAISEVGTIGIRLPLPNRNW
jgi:hypothetical protein